jgi:hypothetical protein
MTTDPHFNRLITSAQSNGGGGGGGGGAGAPVPRNPLASPPLNPPRIRSHLAVPSSAMSEQNSCVNSVVAMTWSNAFSCSTMIGFVHHRRFSRWC